MYATISEFITADERDALKESEVGERLHPIIELFLREDGKSQQATNTQRALKQISSADEQWLDKLKPRLLRPNAIEAASALSELRAYGSLLEAGYRVIPIATDPIKPTPDFTISDGGGE